METEYCVTWWNVQTLGPDWGRLPDDVLQVYYYGIHDGIQSYI